jgi:hypothetical protein
MVVLLPGCFLFLDGAVADGCAEKLDVPGMADALLLPVDVFELIAAKPLRGTGLGLSAPAVSSPTLGAELCFLEPGFEYLPVASISRSSSLSSA